MMDEPYKSLGDCPITWNAHYFQNNEIEHSPGLTIRQWYKGQAIKLFVLDRKDVKDLQADRTPDHNCTSKFCGDLADAMIREDEEHAKKAK